MHEGHGFSERNETGETVLLDFASAYQLEIANNLFIWREKNFIWCMRVKGTSHKFIILCGGEEV